LNKVIAMSRIVYFNIPAHGHVNPTLPVVAELVRRGEHVVYYNYADDDFKAPIERTGAEARMIYDCLPYDHARPDPTILRPGPHLTEFLLRASLVFLPVLLRDLEREPADLIVYDSLCPWARFAARVLGVPSVRTSVTFAFRKGVLPPMRPDQLAWAVLSGAGAILRHWGLARKLRRTYNLDGLDFVSVLTNPGDLNLVFTSREFQPDADGFDDSYRFVGPSIADRHDPGAFPADRLEGGKGVYISLGTLHTQSERFYRTCLEAFKDWQGPVVMNVGKHTDVTRLGAIPGHFTVRPFVPQLEVLKRAGLFLSHAGMNSVSESLWHGVPLLLLPQTGEQLMVARRAASVGAGLVLGRRDLRPDALRRKALDVLRDPRFRERAAAAGASLRRAGGYARAAEEILRFKAACRPGPARRREAQHFLPAG
jgi:MGT family glycosyltransferase